MTRVRFHGTIFNMTRTGKLEKRETIFESGESQGILLRLKRSGKSREFYPEYWKNQKKLYWKIEKNTGKVKEICQPEIVKTLQIWYHTLNLKKNFRKDWKTVRQRKSQGNLSI